MDGAPRPVHGQSAFALAPHRPAAPPPPASRGSASAEPIRREGEGLLGVHDLLLGEDVGHAAVAAACNVGILDGDSVLYLDRVESNFPLRAELHPGSRVPVHCTGLGKLFLAYLPPRTRKRLLDRIELKTFTERTLTSPDAIEEDCAETRQRGYSVNNQEYHDGIISVAVPVYSDADNVIAGLAIHAPAARMSVEDAVKHVPLLNEYAAMMAEDLSAEADPA